MIKKAPRPGTKKIRGPNPAGGQRQVVWRIDIKRPSVPRRRRRRR